MAVWVFTYEPWFCVEFGHGPMVLGLPLKGHELNLFKPWNVGYGS